MDYIGSPRSNVDECSERQIDRMSELTATGHAALTAVITMLH